jgi:hypothetical protein
MSKVLAPSWRDLTDVVRSAQSQLLICSPYYSGEALGRLFDDIGDGVQLHFWGRLSPSDWANGISDPETLLALLQLLKGRAELGICQRLHAKAYAADDSLALVGSANLSRGGFDGNLELVVRFEAPEAAGVVTEVRKAGEPHLRGLRDDQLEAWIDKARPAVLEAARRSATEADLFESAQKHLDKLLGFGGADSSTIANATPDDLGKFVDWLRRDLSRPGAKVLVDRATNVGGQNLTGHFQQCFHGSWRFLEERRELEPRLSASLDDLEAGDVFQPDDTVNEAWIKHLDEHATDAGEGFSYSILRGYLPPSLGGTVTGGGGGSSTLKRMLPLVARFRRERR